MNDPRGVIPSPTRGEKMTFMYSGERISEKDLYSIVYGELSDDRYERMLDEEYPLVKVADLEYGVGFLLRRADYEHFKKLRYDDCDYYAHAIPKYPVLGERFDIFWSEDEERE